jgi:biopolymer transport protein ExbD
MPFYRSIRSRRRRKRINKDFELQLTSMMDVLVIIVVFLLKSYSASTNNFTSVAGMKMPTSQSLESPLDSLQVIVTPEAITFENERISEFVQTASAAGSSEANYTFKPADLDERGLQIIPLYDALIKARDKSEVLRIKSNARDAEGKPLPFRGVLAIQADKRVKFEVLRRIMYTAGAAGYDTIRFLALAKET